MIDKRYRATTGYHDLQPGQTEFGFMVRTTDEGRVIFTPKGPFTPQFNEIQIEGDPDLRRQFLPPNTNDSAILLLDNPDYNAFMIRRQTLATAQIPMEHSDDFVARWAALSNASEDMIRYGHTPDTPVFATKAGSWGGIRELSVKKDMLQYIDGIPDDVLESLHESKSSRSFATRFINWRETLSGRIVYKPLEEEE